MDNVIVAAGSALAAEAGARIADAGGNAVDAAIAGVITSMCTDPGIVTPAAGGFIAIDPPDGEAVVIDAYAEMPGRGVDPDRIGSGRRVRMGYGGGMETVIGYGSVATPGAWAGLEVASRRWGVLPWSELFGPAIDASEMGFPLSTPAAEYLEHSHELVFGWDPASRAALHTAEGRPLVAGELLRLPELADSLRLLSREGAATLYHGELGAAIVAAVDAGGGLLTRLDLSSYRAIVRRPLTFDLSGATVHTNPEPAVGGATMAAIALLAVAAGFSGWSEKDTAELVRVQRVVLDYRRRRLTNELEIPEGIRRLMEAARLGEVGTLIASPSTAHISAADRTGLACSITISAGYGSGAMPAGTGIWLNNSLGELELHPVGYHGLPPGTRLVSNMAPTTVRHDGSALAIGSPGADRITTALSSVLLNHLVIGMSLDDAVTHPRVHAEVFETRPTIAAEPGLPVDAIDDMVLRRFPAPSMYFGGVTAAASHPERGLTATADPRRAGAIATGGRGGGRGGGRDGSPPRHG